MKVFVVIPTYNERDNIRPLCEQILALGGEWQIVVVDDNSPNGTAAEVQALAEETGRVHLLARPGKLGFASAIKAGFRYALGREPDYVVEMDADFSHDPQYLPQMLARAEGAEVVIGSRYIPGGGTRRWGLLRRWLSRGANQFARWMLGLQVHDCTAGFRCYRSEALRQLDWEAIAVEGYSFLIEMTYRCQQKGYRLAEVPIVFVDRQRGKSKISRRIIVEAFFLVLRLAWERLWRRFA
ncbi:MAG TPA: polyprenol monophosphomannose synthase [Armatimonadetes bacterium]|nr:polyprenol monophosphomannose synthase [Armatimonadota bacterium]